MRPGAYAAQSWSMGDSRLEVVHKCIRHELRAGGGHARVVLGKAFILHVHVRDARHHLGGHLRRLPGGTQPAQVPCGECLCGLTRGVVPTADDLVPGVVEILQVGPEGRLARFAEPVPPLLGAVGRLISPSLADFGVVLAVIETVKYLGWHELSSLS